MWLPVALVLLGTGWGANQFTPMLLVYEQRLGLTTGTVEAMFGLYALGLVPGLLIAGPLSDARGRRPVVIPAAVLSVLASATLAAGAERVSLLFLGRLLAGVSSGIVFSAGTAWLRETSTGSPAAVARRAAIAMTAGFCLGPLVAGILAQWAPAPRVLPYLPHIAVMIAATLYVLRVPETVRDPGSRPVRLSVPGVGDERFRRSVAPMAPWVFAAPAIAFALLPTVVGSGIALTAVVASLTGLAGVFAQPAARRLGGSAGTAGLLVLVIGLLLAAVTASAHGSWLLVPCALVLGCAYGLCLTAGLVEVQHLARDGAVAGLTAAYYAITYVGFAAPVLMALAHHVAGYPVLLLITALLALITVWKRG